MANQSVYPEVVTWKTHVNNWYPELQHKTYSLPAMYMNKTNYTDAQFEGKLIYLLQPLTHESDAREDATHNLILRCIEQMSEGHVMFVISQLQFFNYLDNLSSQADASNLPRAAAEGDFDILIIDKSYGLMACEIKAVGSNFATYPPPDPDKSLRSRVERAATQMEKSRTVLTDLTSKDQSQPRIRATLILPHISAEHLRRVVESDPQLKQRLCQCLDDSRSTDPIPLCLTSDDVSNPSRWWEHRMTKDGPDPAMTDDAYEDLVARFAGPATTVTVPCSAVRCPNIQVPGQSHPKHTDIRTPGEGVEETASRFTPVDIVLYPSQLAILNETKHLVFLCGPPGTGKTLMLVLKGLRWLQRKKPIHIVSVRKESLAASHMIQHQLQQMAGQLASQQLFFYSFDMASEIHVALQKLGNLASSHNGEIFIIADEACDRSSSKENFTNFCTELNKRVSGLHLWAASMYHDVKPTLLEDLKLTDPLRTPPSVTRHVQQHRGMGETKNIRPYTQPAAPLPAEGPSLRTVIHEGEGHALDQETYDCVTCGKKVGEILLELEVGGQGRTSTMNPSTTNPQPPRYRDVFVLTWEDHFQEEERDDTGEELQAASGLLQGLRESGFPVTVLESDDAGGVEDVATMSGPDTIIAANCASVQGLERKIVVFVQTSEPLYVNEDWGRLYGMSRCTAQLIWVRPK